MEAPFIEAEDKADLSLQPKPLRWWRAALMVLGFCAIFTIVCGLYIVRHSSACPDIENTSDANLFIGTDISYDQCMRVSTQQNCPNGWIGDLSCTTVAGTYSQCAVIYTYTFSIPPPGGTVCGFNPAMYAPTTSTIISNLALVFTILFSATAVIATIYIASPCLTRPSAQPCAV